MRFPLLDGLRAIAALSVVGLHVSVQTDYFPGWQGAVARQLAAGVAVFFVLSGFLLYRPFVRARVQRERPIRFRDYSRRRLLRIVPAYWLALTVLAVWPGLPGSVFGTDWWLYYGFAQDAQQDTLFNGLGTAWSLGTEVSFYLLLPLYAVGLRRLSAGRHLRGTWVAEIVVLFSLSLGAYVFRRAVTAEHSNLGYTLFGTFDWFAIGMGLAVMSVVVTERGRKGRLLRAIERRPSLSWFASVAILMLGAAYWMRTKDYNAYSGGPLHLIWGASAFFLVLPAAFPGGGRGLPRRLLSTRLLAWLGLVSYGIYLWHLPLVPELAKLSEQVLGLSTGLAATLVLYLGVVTVTVACAAASYYLIERPILRFKNGRPTRSHGGSMNVRLVAENKAEDAERHALA